MRAAGRQPPDALSVARYPQNDRDDRVGHHGNRLGVRGQRGRQGADHRDAVARRDGLAGAPKGTIKYFPTVPNSALDRDRDTVEACRLVPGMRCRPGYKNVYLIERFDEGSTSRSNRPPGPSAVTTSSSSPRPDHASIERSTRSYACAASVDDGNRGW
jgi:hypothetical protein